MRMCLFGVCVCLCESGWVFISLYNVIIFKSYFPACDLKIYLLH